MTLAAIPNSRGVPTHDKALPLLAVSLLLPAGLLTYALSAAEPKPAADGLEEKEEKFDYTIKGETKHGTRQGDDAGPRRRRDDGVRAHQGGEVPDGLAGLHKEYEGLRETAARGGDHEGLLPGQVPGDEEAVARFVEATKYKTEAEADGKGGWGYDGKDVKQDPKFTCATRGSTRGTTIRWWRCPGTTRRSFANGRAA